MATRDPEDDGCSTTAGATGRGAPRAGIVGAGIAGAACAGALTAAGWQVDVFEKARGAGGRLSTRRIEQGWATLGSPFISARREPFRSQLREWARQGWLEPVRKIWQGRANLGWSETTLQTHYRPLIEPSRLVRQLLGGAELHTGITVRALQPRTILFEDGTVRGDYDCVICSVPVPQALPMLDALPLLRDRLLEVRYRPVWSFLMRWDGGPPADVLKFDDARLDLAVRQTGGGEGLWAVHSTHAFAETYLDVSSFEASTRAASALMGLAGLPFPVEVEAAHLWRYARPDVQPSGFWAGDRANRVALIGDGVAGDGVERAWESGVRLAQAILQAGEELAL